MISEAELIVDRRRMKRRLTFWRVAAVLLALTAVLALAWSAGNLRSFQNHIARIRIDGLITGDQPTLDLLDAIAKAGNVKALIVRIESPGGTTAGSEAVYEGLRKIARDKPVVAVVNMTPLERKYRLGLPAAGQWREILNTAHAGERLVRSPSTLVVAHALVLLQHVPG